MRERRRKGERKRRGREDGGAKRNRQRERPGKENGIQIDKYIDR